VEAKKIGAYYSEKENERKKKGGARTRGWYEKEFARKKKSAPHEKGHSKP